MNSLSGIFIAVSLVFGGGYALDKIYVTVKGAVVERVHHGMPPLSEFTNRLTCPKISNSGTLIPAKCGKKHQQKND